MPPTLLPPKRIPAPAAPAPAEAAPAAEAPAQPAPEAAPAAIPAPAPAATPAPKKATVPKSTPKLAPPKKTPPKATAKVAKAKPAKKAVPPKRAAPVKLVKKVAPKRTAPVKRSSPAPATENVVPKVPKIRTSHWSEEAVELAVLVHDMKQIVPAVSKKRVELRAVSPRLQVMFNEKLGTPCQLCYSLPEHVGKIAKLLKKVPAEVLPFKWPGAFERIDKFLDKLK